MEVWGFWTMVPLSSREHPESEETLSILFRPLPCGAVSPQLLPGSPPVPRGAAAYRGAEPGELWRTCAESSKPLLLGLQFWEVQSTHR